MKMEEIISYIEIRTANHIEGDYKQLTLQGLEIMGQLCEGEQFRVADGAT